MSEGVAPLSASEKRGRTFLSTALALIAFLIVRGVWESTARGASLEGNLVGTGLLLLVLVLAFRGGQIAMQLTRGCLLLFGALGVLLIFFIAFSLFHGRPLTEPPSFANTIPFLAYVAGISFSVWALFVSDDVKAFVRFQRETTHQRNLRRIKGTSGPDRGGRP